MIVNSKYSFELDTIRPYPVNTYGLSEINLDKIVCPESPVIGLLANKLYDEYGFTIWDGIKKGIRECGYNLLSFIGGSINNPYYNNYAHNSVYNLASAKNVAGIIIISSSIGSYINKVQLANFFKSFRQLPLISIGISIDTIPSIVIDNTPGMRSLMLHLVKDHGYRRIAFIRGPKNSEDAHTRFKVYKEVLRECDIPVEKELIVQGSFHANSSKKTLSYLLDERKVYFDALIGANDNVAISAISDLKERGIRVPEDIAVVGFDDITDSKYLEQSLTTVNQPTVKIGYSAAKAMIFKLNNHTIPLEVKIPSQLVIRHSCGCNKMNDIQYDYSSMISLSSCKNMDILVPVVVKVMSKEFQDMPVHHLLSAWARQLLDAAVKELEGETKGDFLIILDAVMKKAEQDIPDVISWNTVICFIFNVVVLCLSVPPKPDKVVNLLKSTLMFIHRKSVRNLKYSIVKSNEYEKQMFIIKKMLNTVMDLDQLKHIIKTEFPLIGIKSCYISMYDNGKNRDTCTYSRLLIAYRNNIFVEVNDTSLEFLSTELIPGGIKHINNKGSWSVYSLSYKSELLGFIIYEIDQKRDRLSDILILNRCSVCEVLAIELGNVLKSIMLFSQVEKQTKHIEKKACEHYSNSQTYTLPEKKAREYYKRLLMYIENEAAYLDPDLSLDSLSEQLDISRNHISFIINKYAKVNFYNFINSYRIEKAKDYLKKVNGKVNMLMVAYDSGFNSKSTFYKSFKEATHMTPTCFRKLYNPG